MRIILLITVLLAYATSSYGQGFQTKAPAAVILDGETGTVLFEKNARQPIPPASMTKIMTLYMVFERLSSGALSLDDLFTVSDDAWRRGGFRSGSSTMCLRPNQRVRVEDLIKGLVVLSGNDAAITLAENISGSEPAFAKAMTIRAHELGLSSVNFVNANGWPAESHVISVLDLARLSQMIINKFPEYYKYFAQREYDWCKAAPSNRYNRNPLLALFEGADGLKTGHTKAAGYGLAASAKRGADRRIIVLTAMTSNRQRSRESERVMRAAFREFSVQTLFAEQQPIGEVSVYLGKQKSVAVRTKQPVMIGLFKPNSRKVNAQIVYNGPVSAPIIAGQKLAVLRISVPGQPDIEADLVAVTSVSQKGFLSRVLTGLVQFIQGTDGE